MHGEITASALSDCLPALHRFALKLTRSMDRADDLVQDSVERALSKAALFDGENLRAWLFTICRRIFLNQIRKDKAVGTAVGLDNAPQGRLVAVDSQEQTAFYNQVVDAFDRLPMRDKVILSLVTIEGLKYEEAAEVLDVPVGTVRSRLARARARLQSLVENQED